MGVLLFEVEEGAERTAGAVASDVGIRPFIAELQEVGG